MVDFADAVSFVAASSGTGSFVYSSSVNAFLTPAQGFTLALLQNGATYPYFAVDSVSSPTQREWGTATYTESTGTFTRNVFGGISSGTATGPGSPVSFGAAPTVTLTLLAEYMTNGDFTASTASTTVTISIASPAVISWTGHGFVPNQVVQFTTTGSLPTGISPSTNYYVLASGLTANSFQISASPNGSAVNTSGTQSGTQTGTGQSLVIPYPSIVAGPSGLTGSQTTPLLSLTQTWNTTGNVDAAFLLNVDNIASGGSSLLLDLQVGGSSKFTVSPSGIVAAATGFQPTNGSVAIGGGLGNSLGGAGNGVQISSGCILAWAYSGLIGSAGIILSQDTTNATSLALLNANNSGSVTNAASFHVYNTSDTVGGAPTNYERGVFDWTTTTNVLTIGTQEGGTGSTRNLEFVVGGTNELDFGITNASVWTSAAIVIAANFAPISSSSASGNISPTPDTAGMYIRTALAAACTISAPTGTFFDGQKLEFRLKDNGSSQTLTWTTSSGGFRAINVTLPTSTTTSKNHYIGAIWNSADSFWDVVAVQIG